MDESGSRRGPRRTLLNCWNPELSDRRQKPVDAGRRGYMHQKSSRRWANDDDVRTSARAREVALFCLFCRRSRTEREQTSAASPGILRG
jgi:hypothetical protein